MSDFLRKIAEELKKGFGSLAGDTEKFIPLAESVLRIVRENDGNKGVCICRDVVGRTWSCDCPAHGGKYGRGV